MNDFTEDLSPSNDPAFPAPVRPNAHPPTTAHRIFFGADGLRAGWGLLLFLTLFAALLFAVGAIVHKVAPSGGHTTKNILNTRFVILNEFVPFFAVVVVTWVMSKLESRPIGVFGLGGEREVAHFFAGLAWGVVCLSLLVLLLWKMGLLVVDRRLLFGGDVMHYAAVWLFSFVLVGLLEEYLTRGYLQYTLTRGLAGFYRWAFKTRHSTVLGFWTSALVLSFVFGFSHGNNPGESPIGLLSAGLIGLVFCLSLWRTGSLWWALGFHAAWDWAQSFLYGVADSGAMIQQRLLETHPQGRVLLSGGATGPEGSVFILAIVALVALIILFTLPRGEGGYRVGVLDSTGN